VKVYVSRREGLGLHEEAWKEIARNGGRGRKWGMVKAAQRGNERVLREGISERCGFNMCERGGGENNFGRVSSMT